jgi:hypothetical protein
VLDLVLVRRIARLCKQLILSDKIEHPCATFFCYPPLFAKMLSASGRFNLLKERFYKEGQLPLSIALDGFLSRKNHEIIEAWDTWALARKQFIQSYYSIIEPLQLCHSPPPDGAEYAPCREMWIHLLRKGLEENKEHFHVNGIKDTVEKILASEACKSHPPSCPCKLPNNPFTWWEVLEVLEPLCVKHNPLCNCAPPSGCKQQPKPTPTVDAAPSPYKHNVDDCPCGTCHKSRVDAGTDHAYYERCLNASRAILKTLPAKEKKHDPKTCACGTCHTARVASGTQGAYDEWNRKAIQASLGKFVADSGYSATMRRVYCPSHPANASPLTSFLDVKEEANLFREGNSLLHKLTKIIGPEKFRERLALIREFVPKLEAFLERSKGGLLDSTLRKAMQCDDHVTTRQALASSWGHIQGLLADVFSKIPPEVNPSPLNSLLH